MLPDQTQQYIREAVFAFPNIDLLEGTKEFAILQEQVKEFYPEALGQPKKTETKPEAAPVKVDKKAALQAQITENSELIDLLKETLKEKPKDTETKELLELLKETDVELKKQLKSFEDGGAVATDTTEPSTEEHGAGGVVLAAVAGLATGAVIGTKVKGDKDKTEPAKNEVDTSNWKYKGAQPYNVSLEKYGHLKKFKEYPKKIRWYEPNGVYENRTFEKWNTTTKKWKEIDSVEFDYFLVSLEETNSDYTYHLDKKAKGPKGSKNIHQYNKSKKSTASK